MEFERPGNSDTSGARWPVMLWRPFFVYSVVEGAAVIALASTVGWGWTMLALLAAFVLGWAVLAPMAGSHLIHQIGRLRSGADTRNAVSDGALVALATVLVLIPGLVTSVLGLLLLVPSIRAAAGPRLTSIAVRGFQRRIPLIGYAAAVRNQRRRGDGRAVVDGEVIDVHDFEPPALDVEPPALPHDPATRAPGSL